MDEGAVISVRGLCKNFGKTKVLNNINFDVYKGETIAIIGPSGVGKSTMLRCLINLEKADEGSILIDGQYLVKNGNYEKERICRKICSKMGMVFQSFHLFPHLTVLDNLIYAPKYVNKEDEESAKMRADEILRKVGLADRKESMPSQLSGGQQQRIAIARALMMNPEILLFDEPTSSLDPLLKNEVLTVMRQLAEEKMTMLVVTHEMGFAKEVADRVLFVSEEGIIADDSPDKIFNFPTNPIIKEFICSIKAV